MRIDEIVKLVERWKMVPAIKRGDTLRHEKPSKLGGTINMLCGNTIDGVTGFSMECQGVSFFRNKYDWLHMMFFAPLNKKVGSDLLGWISDEV